MAFIDELDEALATPETWARFREVSSFDNGGRPIPLTRVDFSQRYFENYDFSDLDLEGAVFDSCSVIKCDFSRSNLFGSSWNEAEILSCNFSGSLATDSSFAYAEISLCDFTGCELTNSDMVESALEGCDFSRARGLSQHIIDHALGSERTLIPQSLDYPEHWQISKEQLEETAWRRKLTALRGDDLILCLFDGKRLSTTDFAQTEREEMKQTLKHLQRQVRYAIDDRILHNEIPRIFRAIEDYYEAITVPSSDEKSRKPAVLHELKEIEVGLEGTNLVSLVEAYRDELLSLPAEKLATLNHICQSHMIIVSGLTRWRSFLQSAVESRVTKDELPRIGALSDAVCSVFDDRSDVVDPDLPNTLRILRRLMDKPGDVARLGAYGIIRSIESVFNALFSYSQKFIDRVGEDSLDLAPKATVRLLVAALLGAGALHVFSIFPYLQQWLQGGIAVLKMLNIVQ